MRKLYLDDLTNNEWAIVEPLLPKSKIKSCRYEITAEIEEDLELITHALSTKGRFIVASNE